MGRSSIIHINVFLKYMNNQNLAGKRNMCVNGKCSSAERLNEIKKGPLLVGAVR